MEVYALFCPKCGKMNPDDRENCSGCGAVLHESKEQAPRKKTAVGKIIALIAAAAVVVGGSAAAAVSCSKEPAVAYAQACFIINTDMR